jgi:hypothetical protein
MSLSRSWLRRRAPIIAFLAWTAYVWTTRIVNAWTASDESTAAKVLSTVIAVALLVGALGGAAIVVKARARSFDARESSWFVWLARAAFVVWAVRVPQILLDGGRDVPFKVVHVVLGVISVALAAWTLVRAGHDAEPAAAGRTVSPAVKAGR